jgi:hypothetical protein
MTRIKILLTALSFEKKMLTSAGRINLAAQGACDTAAELKLTQGRVINGVPLTFNGLGEIKSKEQLAEWTRGRNINVLFICDLPPAAVGAVAEVARDQRIIVLSENPTLIESSAVLTVGIQNDHPRLMLNVSKAKEVGAEFDGRIFGVATIYH